jgi:hypothetical protein
MSSEAWLTTGRSACGAAGPCSAAFPENRHVRIFGVRGGNRPGEDARKGFAMSQDSTGPQHLPGPLRAVASGLRRLPGAGQVGKVADGALDRIGAVSPRGRRMAVYAGAGVLGVAGAVEWPVAVTGAAVAWLTQPRPQQGEQQQLQLQDEAADPAPSDPGDDTAEPQEAAGDEPAPTQPQGAAGDEPAPNPSPSHHEHVHETAAKVGDPVTASALKQVAEASAHHDPAAPGA